MKIPKIPKLIIAIIFIFCLLLLSLVLTESISINFHTESTWLTFSIFILKVTIFSVVSIFLYFFSHLMELSSHRTDIEIKSSLLVTTTLLTFIFCLLFL